MKGPFSNADYIRMRDHPDGGLDAWLPRDWLDAKIEGRPYKYPDEYLYIYVKKAHTPDAEAEK